MAAMGLAVGMGVLQLGMGIAQIAMMHNALQQGQGQGSSLLQQAGGGGAAATPQESAQVSPQARYDQAGNNFFQTLQSIDPQSADGQALQQIRQGVKADAAAAKQNGQPFDAVQQLRDRSFSWAMNQGKQNPNDNTAFSVASSAQQFKLAELNMLAANGQQQH
jgi:hypothetical protein